MKFSILAAAFEKLENTAKRLEMTDILAELFKKTDSENIRKIIYLIQNQVEPSFKGIEIGMGEKFVEKSIATATGYDVQKIHKKYDRAGDLGIVAEELLKKRNSYPCHQKSCQWKMSTRTFIKLRPLLVRARRTQR